MTLNEQIHQAARYAEFCREEYMESEQGERVDAQRRWKQAEKALVELVKLRDLEPPVEPASCMDVPYGFLF